MNEPKQELLRYPAARLLDIAKALSSDIRLRILEALGERPLSVSQLAETLGAAQPTISINVQVLEQAELVVCRTGSGREKICTASCRSVLLELPLRSGDALRRVEEIRMPIGLYSRCEVQAPCGMASRDGVGIGSPDDPRVFYMPERTEAAVIWFSGSGRLEYEFANPMPPGAELDELVLTAELCSEAPGFHEDWPSDITALVNGRPIGMYTSPGDFGDRKGRFTPERWRGNTEYGRLTEWKITREGSFLNGEPCSELALGDLQLTFNEPVRIALAVPGDAGNPRGLNLFGAGFGDYAQDLVLSFVRRARPEES